MDNMKWLLTWFHNQCDGDWEHANGIQIGTLDNPGWFLKVSLEDTELEGYYFNFIEVERSENNWYHCMVEDNIFKGYGGPFNLPEILKIFRTWAEQKINQT